MCGFYGTNQITSFNIENNQIIEADRLMALRGPDDCMVFKSNHIFLKHFRLITRGSSEKGKQPFIGERMSLDIFFGTLVVKSKWREKRQVI